MIIDHICFAVKDLKKGVADWTVTFAYEQMTEVVTNTKQNVKVVFLQKEGSLTIKLIEPCQGNKALEDFLTRGGGFHHLCFKCDSIVSEMKTLKSKGVVKLIDPQPGEAFDNEDIAFMLTRFGINLELIETDKKAKLL